jgi:predicted Rossmann fold nucleotide-binding protein DprA/Smf involved in DNA uptake
VLRANSPATHLVQRIRDEAHRFAITFHRKLRSKSLMASQLDQVRGIGEIKRTRLLKQYGSLANIAAATDNELKAAGLDAKTVAEIRKALPNKPSEPGGKLSVRFASWERHAWPSRHDRVDAHRAQCPAKIRAETP